MWAEVAVGEQKPHAERRASGRNRPARPDRPGPASGEQRCEDHKRGHRQEHQSDAIAGIANDLLQVQRGKKEDRERPEVCAKAATLAVVNRASRRNLRSSNGCAARRSHHTNATPATALTQNSASTGGAAYPALSPSMIAYTSKPSAPAPSRVPAASTR